MLNALAGSTLSIELARQRGNVSCHRTVVLATDLDDTFVMRDPALSALTRPLTQELAASHIPVVYVTGNGFSDVAKRIERGDVPTPDAIATAVGTELWLRSFMLPVKASSSDVRAVTVLDETKHLYVRCENWQRVVTAKCYNRLAAAQGWQALIEEFAALDQDRPEASRYNLQFQRPDDEATFLASCELPVGLQGQENKCSVHFFADRPDMVHTLQQRARAVIGQEIVVCGEINWNAENSEAPMRKWCADALPVTKAAVIEWLKWVSQVDVMVVAGDSGNDTRMLLDSGDLAVVVGGAHTDLVTAVLARIVSRGYTELRPGLMEVLENSLEHEMGTNKQYVVDTTRERLGPQSILHAMRLGDLLSCAA